MSDRFGRAAAAVASGGGRPPRVVPAPSGPVEGKVKAVTAAGVTFTVADYDGGTHVFGPAPWHRGAAAATDADGVGGEAAHVHAAAPPAVGARCLVVFVGTGIERPWVVAWY
jgi:hypothetical protein